MFVPLNTELMLDICCSNSVTSNIPPKMHFRDVKQGLMMGYLVIPVVFDWPWTICHRLWMEQKAELQYLCSCCHRLMSFTYIHFIFSWLVYFPNYTQLSYYTSCCDKINYNEVIKFLCSVIGWLYCSEVHCWQCLHNWSLWMFVYELKVYFEALLNWRTFLPNL